MSTALIRTSDEWVTLQRQCKAFLVSGFLPDHIAKGDPDTALARAITIAAKGRELGIPPLQAFSSITVIKGKPCLSAELMLALCYQRVPGFQANFITARELAHLECTIGVRRGKGAVEQFFTFTLEDAKRAGLLGSTAWQKFPAAMLRARVISAACRAVAPDAIMGCYTPEELGAEVVVEEDETVSVVEPKHPTESKVELPPQVENNNRDTEKSDKPAGGVQGDHGVTIAQLDGLRTRAVRLKLTGDDGDALLKPYGVTRIEQLDKHQASHLIKELDARLNQSKAGREDDH